MILPLGIGAVRAEKLIDFCQAKMPNALRGTPLRRLVTDSREVAQGDLFVALSGNEDGHRYTKEAEANGAIAVLAERQTDASLPHIIVQNVRTALGDWANAVIKDRKILRIGITGSVGKTTVKDAVAAMLSSRYTVHATYKNFNNELGLPFTILTAPKGIEVLVCEIGISHKGEMRPLSRILSPHIALITCIGHAHIGAFGTRNAIAEEKAEILSYTQSDGWLIVPQGEPLLSFVPPRGIKRLAVLPFTNTEIEKYGLPFSEKDIPRTFSMAYALAIANICALTPQERQEGFARILAQEMHRKESVISDILFIDDTYNASPEAMIGALTYLSEKRKGKRIAVLGDMLELGEDSPRFHRAVGKFAASCADILFFFGAHAADYMRGATAGGARAATESEARAPVYFVLTEDVEKTAECIARHLNKQDAVLFKAARAVAAEKLVSLCKQRIL